jgi:hypothetical protein
MHRGTGKSGYLFAAAITRQIPALHYGARIAHARRHSGPNSACGKVTYFRVGFFGNSSADWPISG